MINIALSLALSLSPSAVAQEKSCPLEKQSRASIASNIEKMQAHLLYQFVCPPKLALPPAQGEAPMPAELRERVQQSVHTILITNPDANKESVQLKGLGSGFSVRAPEGHVVMTAAHVSNALKAPAKSRLLISKGEEFFEVAPDGQSGKARVDQILDEKFRVRDFSYDEDKAYPPIPFLQIGIDLGQIQTASALSSQPLEVRDLEKEPVSFNEPLYLFGRQLGVLRTFDCANRGISEDIFREKKAIELLAACSALKSTKGAPVPLGGISGGAIVDSKGRAVAAFNGYIQNDRDFYVRGTPIYFSKKSKAPQFNAYPAIDEGEERSVQCFPCYNQLQAESANEFASNPDRLQKFCVLTQNRRDGRVMMLQSSN